MTDYNMTDSDTECMFIWIEQHDKVCPFAYMGSVNRFEYSETTNDNVCVVRVTCKCGEIKVVTICCKE
jgi:hypothetical protein